MPEKSKAQRNNRSNQLNPSNMLHSENKGNQNNPNNDAYWLARGFSKRPADWRERTRASFAATQEVSEPPYTWRDSARGESNFSPLFH